MKLITRDTDYAIRALVCIAGEKKNVVSVVGLSKKMNMPRAYLRKILQQLSKNKLLKSSKGKGGGFSLMCNPKKVTVFSLIEIFQGPFQLSEHVFKGKKCPKMKTCRLKKRLDEADKTLTQKLKAITLLSLMK
ncbi:MAG: Rrf2 family transcriptional regulator [Candidatus Omnitrophota bacterium]